jgi:hypothetical protein
MPKSVCFCCTGFETPGSELFGSGAFGAASDFELSFPLKICVASSSSSQSMSSFALLATSAGRVFNASGIALLDEAATGRLLGDFAGGGMTAGSAPRPGGGSGAPL